jgi:hypothetical protein
MKRIILIAAFCLVALSLSPFTESSIAQQRTQLGGRPGEFHFILKEQADYNRVQFRETQMRIQRLRSEIIANSSDEAKRTRMLTDLDQFAMFVASMETQLSTPAGQTAGEVEQRLNVVKGQTNCATCHENGAVRASR